MKDKPLLEKCPDCKQDIGISLYETIHLQYAPNGETTWCEDEINENDVNYILKSKYDDLLARAERAEAKLAALQKTLTVVSEMLDEAVGWCQEKGEQ